MAGSAAGDGADDEEKITVVRSDDDFHGFHARLGRKRNDASSGLAVERDRLIIELSIEGGGDGLGALIERSGSDGFPLQCDEGAEVVLGGVRGAPPRQHSRFLRLRLWP